MKTDKNIHLSPAPPSLHCTNFVQKIPPVIFCNTVFGLSTVFGQVNNREAGNLSRNRGHYDVIVMSHKTVVWALAVKLLSGECHRTSPGQHWLTRLLGAIIYSSQHWFRYRVGVIYRTKIDSDLCCHMASLGHNKLSVDLAYIFFCDIK